MIRDKRFWAEWEQAEVRRTVSDYGRNLRLFEGMYEEARALGVFQSESLDSLDVKITIARALNVSGAS